GTVGCCCYCSCVHLKNPTQQVSSGESRYCMSASGFSYLNTSASLSTQSKQLNCTIRKDIMQSLKPLPVPAHAANEHVVISLIASLSSPAWFIKRPQTASTTSVDVSREA